MKYLVNGNQMKAIDNFSITEIGIPSMVLMEKAAMAVVKVMLAGIDRKNKILCICGAGNNGGDGIAVARILKQAGFQADVLFLGDLHRTTEEVKIQYKIAQSIGVIFVNNFEIGAYAIMVDAIFGIGLSREVQDREKEVIKLINSSRATIYAVDIPSGISASDGSVLGVGVKAAHTITFGLLKTGIVLYPGCEYAGKIHVKDIGFPEEAVRRVHPDKFIFEREDLHRLPVRENYSNKGTFGKVLVIAGSKNMGGACFLSAKAAYRSGAGLVKVLTAEANRSIMQTLLPEALFAAYDKEGDLLKQVQWATTIVIGPGLGISEETRRILDFVLNNTNVPMVIDADAINMLAGRKDLPPNIVLTPHLKEMSRFISRSIEDISSNLLEVAEQAAGEEYVLVLKDARTIVAHKDQVYINISGNNGMATGGCGDVLTGIIAAFLAQGMERFEAAAMAVYVHGLSADAVAKKKGVYSLIASDIIEELPGVLNDQEAQKQ